MRRRRRWVMDTFLAGVALSVVAFVCAADPPHSLMVQRPAEELPEGQIRWATYNLAGLNGWHRRRDEFEAQRARGNAMGQAMRAWGATVIGFQELPRDPTLQAALAEGLGDEWTLHALPVRAPADSLRVVGVAVLRERVKAVTIVDVDPRWPTYWGAADIRIDGAWWRVHSGKLSPGQMPASSVKRVAETAMLLPALAADRQRRAERVIVLADLNADVGAPSLADWQQAGWRDGLADMAAAREPTKHDRGEPDYRRRLDYIYLPDALAGKAMSGRVIREGQFGWHGDTSPEPWSDHLPVLMDWETL